MLTTLRGHVESLDGLRGGVTEEQLEERLADTDGSVSRLGRRVEHMSEKVEAAATRLEQKEHELAALHRHFLESSSRVETIVDDLREALGALPEAGPEAVAALAARVDATDTATASLVRRLDQLESAQVDEPDSDLAKQVDRLESRVSTVAEEIGRAKTLWPVALRSLEARLDDVARRQEEHRRPRSRPSRPAQRFTRISSQGSATACRRWSRWPPSWGAHRWRGRGRRAGRRRTHEHEPDEQEPAEVQEAVGGGARIVPLRQGDP